MKYALEICDQSWYTAHILSSSENNWGSEFNMVKVAIEVILQNNSGVDNSAFTNFFIASNIK